jgi:hypothetical protein
MLLTGASASTHSDRIILCWEKFLEELQQLLPIEIAVPDDLLFHNCQKKKGESNEIEKVVFSEAQFWWLNSPGIIPRKQESTVNSLPPLPE